MKNANKKDFIKWLEDSKSVVMSVKTLGTAGEYDDYGMAIGDEEICDLITSVDDFYYNDDVNDLIIYDDCLTFTKKSKGMFRPAEYYKLIRTKK